ncbi:MAG: SDR family oxidoreductase [Kiritimatiellae bacterium]|nr:SDR family oxidoreductase [Kiritimatiellia bacterium]
MHLVVIGPGRIGEGLLPVLQTNSETVTVLSRRDYGDFLAETFAPEKAVASLTACDAVIYCAGLFELNAAEERMLQANCKAITQLADAIHVRFPKAHHITFLDARFDRPLASQPFAIQSYLKSKQALAVWTLTVAKQWGLETGARVNAIAPGPVLPPPDKAHSEKAGTCLTPRPSVKDIVQALTFLLQTPSVTGQILYVAAGQQLL